MPMTKDDFTNLRPGNLVIFQDSDAIYEGDELVFDGVKTRLFKVIGMVIVERKVHISLATSSMLVGVFVWDDKLDCIVGLGERFTEEPLSMYLKMLQSENTRIVKKSA